MRFSHILLVYFVMGAMMFGGGVIEWNQSGVVGIFVEYSPGEQVDVNQDTANDLERLGGPIQEAAESIGGGALIALWSILSNIIGYLFWPITTLLSLNAPLEIVLIFGGIPTVAFFGGIITLIGSTS
ncbi:hypothetical protein C5B90_06420 [Haloferax sp. Atlit-12N]|uniref:hypothetical protein n=1 Tax=Haloferax sp. Atlit-12N TaxID=2077203 RepID=UPI000E22A030|nr:hypothetical protein [Haloferax sp. Atlit-12N]RDZ65978.1 hypothetical protein C5B90_06420 [Haloferax sp. Atlit-12N]